MKQPTISSSEYQLLLAMLRGERKARGYTQAWVAEQLSMPQSTFAKYEDGQSRLDVIQVRDWCRALGVPFVGFMRNYYAAIKDKGLL